jgi:exopolysaccharide production protein ExoQ
MFRWYYLASAYLICQTIGVFGIFDRLIYGEWAGKTGDKLTQILNLLGIVVSVALFWQGYRKSRGIGTGGMLAIGLAFFLILSTLWSVDPPTSMRRGILYLFFVLGVIGIAGSLEGDEFMDLLRNICFWSGVFSLGLLPVLPHLVMMPEGDALRGIFSHKNVLGQIMAGGALASLHGIRAGGRRRWRSMLALAVMIVAAFPARSGTALMTIFAFCSISYVATLLGRGGTSRMLGWCCIAVLTPLAVLVAVFPDALLELLGKDPTLTGRTELWEYVIGFISERPVLGWGLTAFWSTANPLSIEVSEALGWTVPEAHNGLLEMLLEVGVVGTGFFLFLWARTLVLALRCAGTGEKQTGVSALLCLCGIILVGVTEQVLVDPGQVSVIIFFVTGFICERAIREARQYRLSPQEDDFFEEAPAELDTMRAP